MTKTQDLSVLDRFDIFEQLHRHQFCIDGDDSAESAHTYVDLYWSDAKFTVRDIRQAVFEGPIGLKKLYDYAHSVFPLHNWRHSVGTFVIDGAADRATVEWRWIVTWKAEKEGVVSTGSYKDVFEKRDGRWKCLERLSEVDPNWPAHLFQPFVDDEKRTFKVS
jgi:hypothetical protein